MDRTHRISRFTMAGIASAAVLLGCAGSTTPKEPATSPVATATETTSSRNAAGTEVTADPVTECDLVCERAQIVPRPADGPDYNAKATDNANRVIEAMHEDLLACYKKRVAVNPSAHGFITVDAVIDPQGKVRTVETTGGAILGEATMACIVQRIKRGAFDPPHGGGTLRIHVPFSLRRVAPGEDT